MFVILTSCSNISQRSVNVEILHCLNSSEEPSEEIPTYDNLEIIKLETTPLCFISDIKQIEMNDSLIFVLDLDSHLYVFSKNGKFLNQIGKKGEAQSEYIVLNTFFIDEPMKTVVLLDDFKNLLIKYDFKGKHISSISVPQGTIRNSNQALLVEDNKLLLYNMMDRNDNMAYSLVNTEENKLIGKYFSYNPITLNNYFYSFSAHPMTKIDKGADFILPLCDTIFTYLSSSSSFEPKYVVETPKKMASKNQIKHNTPSYSSDLYRLSKDGFFTGFTAIHETDSKLLLIYEHNGVALGYFLFDKLSQEGKYYLYTDYDDMEKVPFFYTIYAYKNKFVGMEKPETISRLKNIRDKRFQDIIKDAKEDDNPYLFVYEMK